MTPGFRRAAGASEGSHQSTRTTAKVPPTRRAEGKVLIVAMVAQGGTPWTLPDRETPLEFRFG